MKRREFLALSGATLFLPSFAHASDDLDYTPGLIKQELAAGKTLFVDFYAEWCSTCRTQRRRIEALRKENPAYDAAMTFIEVDWDTYGKTEITRRYGIPRRSTLLVLRGNEELGRIVAGTSKSDIKALLDLGLGGS